MAWTIKPTRRFERELSKLDKSVQRKIIAWRRESLSPTIHAHSAKRLAMTWRDSGVTASAIIAICHIEDDQLVAVSVGHRSAVYER